jgi:ribose 5-phosphate isomerase B
MKIFIGSDHAGFALKETLKNTLIEQGYQPEDLGCDSAEAPANYATIAHALCDAMIVYNQDQSDPASGILICGSGIGVSIAANRHAHIRAALCPTPEVATLSRQHNDANVLCLAARSLSTPSAMATVHAFLSTAFEGGRHACRVDAIELTSSN